MALHHVGIATRQGAALAELYGDLLDATVAHEEQFEGLSVAFLDCGDCYLELLEPKSAGTVEEYLDDHGPGIHHLAFATDDVAGALDRARELGVELVDEEPRPGAWGHDVAFLHPRSTGGVLVEFVSA